MIDGKILSLAKEWANNLYFHKQDREEIETLIRSGNEKELTERFYRELEFGTGGLRSIMGMGPNRMSKYTVRKATHALALVMKEAFKNKKENLRVALSYDSRHFSKEFALECACVLAGNGIEAFLYSRLNPTPLLSFAVRLKKAQAGIMITASHNPSAYNGYKAYWSNGGQVIPPHDELIITAYNNITDFNSISYMDSLEAEKKGLLHWMGEEEENAYYEKALSHSLNPKLCLKEGKKLNVVYTPIHGTGAVPCLELSKRLGFSQVHIVEEQRYPDGNFSTVNSPNPENPEALALAVKKMHELNADLVCGTDPDADRIGVVINQEGKDVYLNGNQVGVILLNYALEQKKEKGHLADDAIVIKSIVTSEMQSALCEKYGLTIYNTLTGFKWMGGLLDELREKKAGRQFVFASEESYGYLPNDEVRDKDAVSAFAMLCEAALYYKLKGKTLVDVLHDLYEELGFFDEKLLSLDFEGKEGAEKIKRIMETFRNFREKQLCANDITQKEDYLSLINKDVKTGQESRIDLPFTSDVLAFRLADGTKIFLRPSGTEPKIKFYFLVREQGGSLLDKKERAEKKAGMLKEFFKEKAMKA
jgi:phosphoglucomutase